MGKGRRSRSERVFSWLAKLFPGDFRDELGDEMKGVFRQELEQELQPSDGAERRRGFALLRFWCRTVVGVVVAAPRAHLDGIVLDFRYTLRSLLSRPLFSSVAVLSLALGLGASTSVVALLQATFLRSIEGAANAQQLVNVKPTWQSGEDSSFASYPDFVDLRSRCETLDLVGFHGLQVGLSLSQGGEPELAGTQVVTSDYFSVLGVSERSGRFFTAEEETQRSSVVVVSSDFADRRLAPNPIGQSLWVNGSRVEVVGVAESFRGHFIGFDFHLFLPASMADVAGLPDARDRSARWLELVAGLEPGETLDSARAELDLELAALAREVDGIDDSATIVVEKNTGIDADLRGGLLAFLALLAGVAGFVLLIASLNVAGMMLSRSIERRRELAVRQALGAPRLRLHRQLLTETLVIALVGGLVGVGFAISVSRLARSAFASIDPRIALDIHVAPATVVMAMLLSMMVALGAAMTPAFAVSKLHFGSSLRASAATSGGAGKLRAALVIGQVALTLVVLVGSLLFLRALDRATDLDPGFDPSGVHAVFADPDLIQMSEADARSFLDQLLESSRGIPGTEAAALTARVPLTLGARFFANPVTLRVPGHEPPTERRGFAIEHGVVSNGYLDVLRIPLLEGRGFGSEDRSSSRGVAIVNETFAQRFFGDRSPLGQLVYRISNADEGMSDRELEIVGVTADSRYRTLDEEPMPFVYLSFEQSERTSATLLVRGSSAEALAGPVRERFRELAPNLPIADAASLEQRLGVAFLPQRIAAAVTGSLGLAGLFLAMVGLYGVLAYGVQRRAREIGLRSSLGASPKDIVGLVARQGFLLVAVGAAIGIPLSLLVTRFLRQLLYGLDPVDPASYAGVAILLLVAGLVATFLPARRAAAIDPISVLRAE